MSQVGRRCPHDLHLSTRVRMANPQAEKFTRIDNDILWAMLSLDITANEHVVLLAVIRLTWGFQRGAKDTRVTYIALSRLAALTGLTREACSRAVSGLCRKHILLREHRKTQLWLGLQKDFDLWTDRRATKTIAETRKASRSQPLQESATVEAQTIAEIRNRPLQKSATNKRKEDKRKDYEERACENDEEIPKSVRDAIEENLGFVLGIGDIRRTLIKYVAENGEDAVLNAINKTARNLIPRNAFISYMIGILENRQSKSDAPRQTLSPEADRWWKHQPLYTMLEAYARQPDARRRAIADAQAAVGTSLDIDSSRPAKEIVLAIYRAANIPIPDSVAPVPA